MIVGLPVVDAILERHADLIASDMAGYRNHVYRVVNVMHAIAPITPDQHTAVGIAAAFHDIGLWTADTWDYLPPSVAAADAWLHEASMTGLAPLVRGMIENHHKILPCPPSTDPLVEHFRRADWCDVTLGLRSCGVARNDYARISCLFPADGFHRRLVSRALHHAFRHPLRPFPMLRL